MTSSYFSTSSLKMTPGAASQRGRPAAKRSSITHIVNSSAGTGQASSAPSASAAAARVASVGAGTMRSTIAFGNVTDSSSQASRPGSAPAAVRNWTTALRVVLPAESRLSQDSTVTGAPPSE